MASDNISLNGVYLEVTLCVRQSRRRMAEAVKARRGFLDVPIVQEIIVQKCASDERAHIRLNAKSFCESYAHIRHPHGMLVCRNVAVLYLVFLFSEVSRPQNLKSVFFYEFQFQFTYSFAVFIILHLTMQNVKRKFSVSALT